MTTTAESSELAVKKFVARAELSALTRSLRTKLSRAANHPPTPPEWQPRRKSHPVTPKQQQPLQTVSRQQSLFTSILAPPASKQARTILNPNEAPRPAPVRPKTARKSPQKKRKLETADGDVEIKAAETLTSLLQQRSTPIDDNRTSTPRPAAPTDNEAANLMLFLATSPSPVRNKDHRSGRPNPAARGRVLFPQTKEQSPSTDQPPPTQLLPAPALPDITQFINASPNR